MRTMRSVVADTVGEPSEVLHLQTRPIPERGPRQVRIRVAAVPVHASDLHAIRGRYGFTELADAGIALLRPARKGQKPPAGQRFFKPLRQIIESINNTFKSQLDLERHGGRTIAGVAARILQRVLALTAAIWHNSHTGRPILRSLTAYDY